MSAMWSSAVQEATARPAAANAGQVVVALTRISFPRVFRAGSLRDRPETSIAVHPDQLAGWNHRRRCPPPTDAPWRLTCAGCRTASRSSPRTELRPRHQPRNLAAGVLSLVVLATARPDRSRPERGRRSSKLALPKACVRSSHGRPESYPARRRQRPRRPWLVILSVEVHPDSARSAAIARRRQAGLGDTPKTSTVANVVRFR